MPHIHSLTAEWLPVSIAPSDGEDLEVCVMDYDGIILALRTRVTKAGPDGSTLQMRSTSIFSRPIGANGLSVINTRSSACRLPPITALRSTMEQEEWLGQRRLQWHGM